MEIKKLGENAIVVLTPEEQDKLLLAVGGERDSALLELTKKLAEFKRQRKASALPGKRCNVVEKHSQHEWLGPSDPRLPFAAPVKYVCAGQDVRTSTRGTKSPEELTPEEAIEQLKEIGQEMLRDMKKRFGL